MIDDWDSYFCTVEDKPSSIVVNLGLAEEADAISHPVLCYVSIFLRNPDPEGFPAPDEEETIAAMEDSLVESFHAPDTGRCAGHCLTDGRLDVFFYLDSGDNWSERVAAVLDHFPSHQWEAGSHDDPEWELYFGFLYPDDVCMLHIQNRRVCDQLTEQGDDLSVSRRLEHLAIFRSHENATTFAAIAKEMGYALDSIDSMEETDPLAEMEQDGQEPFSMATGSASLRVWQVRLSRPDCPDASDEISLLLFNLAREHNGEYFGWSCAAL